MKSFYTHGSAVCFFHLIILYFPCQYISIPHLDLATGAPALGPALTLLWLFLFLWGEES